MGEDRFEFGPQTSHAKRLSPQELWPGLHKRKAEVTFASDVEDLIAASHPKSSACLHCI
jgi:hypothetical protein